MRSANLGLAIGCALCAIQPASAEGVAKQGAGAAGGAAGMMAGSAVGGPIGGAVGGVVGGAIGRTTADLVGAVVPGGGKKKKLRKAQARADAEAQIAAQESPRVVAVQPRALASPAETQAGDVAATAADEEADMGAPPHVE